MIEVATEIQILAPVKRVWTALIDFENYPKWNPFVVIKGVAEAGSQIEYSFKAAKPFDDLWTTARISQYREPYVLAWTFSLLGVFSLEESFSLQSVANGSRLRHVARCSGLLPALAGRLVRRRMLVVLGVPNERLARYLEAHRAAFQTVERQGRANRTYSKGRCRIAESERR